MGRGGSSGKGDLSFGEESNLIGGDDGMEKYHEYRGDEAVHFLSLP